MLETDRDALICDFAETYHVFDYRNLPLQTAAALAVGLKENSRIKMHMEGASVDPLIMLLASIIDRLGLLVWMNTKDAVHGRNRPASLVNALTDKKERATAFSSGKDFERARKQIISKLRKEVNDGN